ncbi:MAG: HAMP domain-containing sensor histidine kinase [Actinomycetota bacterium]
MFASLRSRLLLVAAVVAAVAVSATALIAQQVASDDLRRALDRDLDTQNSIIAELTEFAIDEASWDEVEPFVTDLSDRADERIAIIDASGRVLADSDPDAPLPSQPTGRIESSDLRERTFEKIEEECELELRFVADDEPVDDEFLDDEFPDDEFPDDGFLDDELLGECIDDGLTLDRVAPSAFVFVGAGDDDASSILGQNGPDTRLIVMATLVIVGAIAAMALALRPVLAPIGALRAGAQHLGDGELETRVPESGATELADLARTFNSMAGSLELDDERRRRWTSDVAHELRSPLQNLRGHVDAAQDGLMPHDEAWFESVGEELDQLSHLVDDLQVLTLTDAGELPMDLRPTEVGSLARDVAVAHEARARRQDVNLSTAGSGRALADDRRLRQVLGNLIDNALRHTPADGSVTVHVDESAGDGPHVTVTVTDTGEGIPQDSIDTIFDRFRRVDEHRGRATGGSGLGLAIVAALVQAHGGTVDVASEVGRGSTFTVSLPSAPPGPDAAPRED